MNGEVRIREDHEMKKAILAIACITVAATLSMTIQSFAEDGAAKPMHVMLPPDVIQCANFTGKAGTCYALPRESIHLFRRAGQQSHHPLSPRGWI